MKLIASTITAASLLTGGVSVYAIDEPTAPAPAAEERVELDGWRRIVTDFQVWSAETQEGLQDQLMSAYCFNLR